MRLRPIDTAGLVIAAIIGLTYGTTRGGDPLPPKAQFRGKTLAEWSVLQNEWAIGTGLGEGSDIPDTIKKVRLLPGGFGGGTFEFDVSIGKGDGIAVSPWFAFGEFYEDGTFDDPNDPFLVELLEFIFADRTVEVWLDGKLVLSGVLNDLLPYAYGPTYFDEPIPYADPTGPAVAAIWTIGVGTVFNPLPPGKHTIFVSTNGEVFGLTEITYNITVK